MALYQFNECEKIIIFGSSKNLITANYWKKKDGHAWVMINHAWKIRERNNDWDKIVCSKDYLRGDEGDKDIARYVTNKPKRYGDYAALWKYPTLKKMENIVKMIKDHNITIGVDGGVNLSNISKVYETGIDVMIVGSGLFDSDNISQRFKDLLNV